MASQQQLEFRKNGVAKLLLSVRVGWRVVDVVPLCGKLVRCVYHPTGGIRVMHSHTCVVRECR